MEPSFRDTLPPTPGKRPSNIVFSKKILLIAGGGLLAVVIGTLLLFSGGGSNERLERLSARLGVLSVMVESAKDTISDDQLRKVNSDLSILIASNITSLAAPLKNAGFDKVSDNVKTAEADTATIAALEDAVLQSNFDATYKRTLDQKLTSTNALIQEIFDSTNSRSLKSVLEKTYTDLKTIQAELEKIN